jgi:ParB-like chromosome segregation protein Spo0J
MDPATTPPLVVSFDGEVLDGNHRYRALKGLGITEVLAYVVK